MTGQPVTMADVDAWIRKAWPNRSKYPSSAAAYSITTRINIVFHNRQKPKTPATPAAIKYARLFLQHLPKIRAEVEMWHSLDSIEVDGARQIVDQEKYDRAEIILAAMARAERSIGEVIDSLRLPRWAADEPERWIADKVAEEWLRADPTLNLVVGHGKAPMCRFVNDALRKIGIRKADATVAEALRGRRHRPRNGRVRAS